MTRRTKDDLARVLSWLVMLLTNWLPDCRILMRLRGWLLGFAMRKCEADFQVASDVRLVGPSNICVGSHVYLASGVVIVADLDVTIEDDVMLAHHVVVTDGNHTMQGGSYRYGVRKNARVRIGRGSWIGANSTVVAGVCIGRGVLVGANSVVTRDVADYSIVAGVPARFIRRIPDDTP